MNEPVKRGRGRPRNAIPKQKVIIYIEPDLVADSDKYAEELNMSRSEFFAMIVKRSVYRRRKQETPIM